MYELKVTNEQNATLVLNPNKNFQVTDVSGITPPTATINSSEIAGGNGELYNSSRIDKRNIVLTIVLSQPIEQNRIALYQYFRMGKRVTLYFKNDSREVQTTGYIENFDTSLFTIKQTIVISIICLDPFLRSAEQFVNELSTVVNLFEFPFAIEEEGIPFSEIDILRDAKILNSGESNTGLIITLYASQTVINPVVYDNTNRALFKINMTMQPRDLITINTNQGQKSVMLTRAGVETNIINNMSNDSTWFSIPPGENSFSYGADDGAEYIVMTISHNDLFEGV